MTGKRDEECAFAADCGSCDRHKGRKIENYGARILSHRDRLAQMLAQGVSVGK